MKIRKARPFSEDKVIFIEGFRGEDNYEIENRWLWSDIIIRRIHCKVCESQDSITFHTRDIPKLIRVLNKLLELQKRKVEKITKRRKKHGRKKR